MKIWHLLLVMLVGLSVSCCSPVASSDQNHEPLPPQDEPFSVDWQQTFSHPLSDWIVEGETLYVLDEKYVTALSIDDKHEIWQVENGGIGMLESVKDTLIVADVNAKSFVGLDLTSGKTLWSGSFHDLFGDERCTGGMVVIPGDNNFFAGCETVVWALDSQNGHILWSYNLMEHNMVLDFPENAGGRGYLVRDTLPLTAAGDKLYVRAKEVKSSSDLAVNAVQDIGCIIALDSQHGEWIWEFTFFYFAPGEGSPHAVATPLLASFNYLFFISLDDVLYALDQQTGKLMQPRSLHDVKSNDIYYSHEGLLTLTSDTIVAWDGTSMQSKSVYPEEIHRAGESLTPTPGWRESEALTPMSFVSSDWSDAAVTLQTEPRAILWRIERLSSGEGFSIEGVDVMTGAEFAKGVLASQNEVDLHAVVHSYTVYADHALFFAPDPYTLQAIKLPAITR